MFDYTEVTNRETYLAFRAAWKKHYMELSRDIRKLKDTRKEFTWEYRSKGDTENKKRTKTGDNPNYNPNFSAWELHLLRIKAQDMMDWLEEIKETRPKKND